MTKIKDWSVCTGDVDRYTPPECIFQFLRGEVTGHPVKPDGTFLHTSTIVSVRGRVVRTRNTTYRLGQPSKDYVRFLRQHGLRVPTGRKPIRVHKPRGVS